MKKACGALILMIVALGAAAGAAFLGKKTEKQDNMKDLETIQKEVGEDAEKPSITVVYDNRSWKKGMDAAWGFSCVVKETDKTILFDTGGQGAVFWANMDRMGIEAKDIDVIVLSHYHMDHVGVVPSFLMKNPDAAVYGLKAFPAGFRKDVEALGAAWVGVEGPMKICDNVYSTGELGSWLKEQSLVIQAKRGSIVITGCAHPGIVEIVKKARKIAGEDVLFVMGGFHLGGESKGGIKKIIAQFRDMGVDYAGPAHCSGEKARKLFKEEYKNHFVDIGAGRVIRLDELR